MAGRVVELGEAGDVEDVVEQLAELVVARLLASGVGSSKLLTVAQVAELLDVPADFVYRHKVALGVIRLPSEGRRGSLRFDRDTVRRRLQERSAGSKVAAPGGRRRPARAPVADAELLPVRPRQAA
jgi:hypothetical protein